MKAACVVLSEHFGCDIVFQDMVPPLLMGNMRSFRKYWPPSWMGLLVMVTNTYFHINKMPYDVRREADSVLPWRGHR